MLKLLSKIKNIKIIFFNKFWTRLLYPVLLFKIPRIIKQPRNFIELLYKNTSEQKDYLVELKNGIVLKSPKDCLPGIVDTWVLEEYTRTKGFNIRKGDIVIDLGANIGSFSLYAASKGAKVYAFEPIPSTFKLLNENIKRNKFTENITAFNLAVTDKNSKEKIFLHKDTALGHSLIGLNKSEQAYLEVSTWDLPTIFAELKINKIDFLKMDIEAAEYPLIYNTDVSYFKKIRKIAMEYHNFRNMPKNYRYRDLRQYLEKIRFKVVLKNPFYIFATNLEQNK